MRLECHEDVHFQVSLGLPVLGYPPIKSRAHLPPQERSSGLFSRNAGPDIRTRHTPRPDDDNPARQHRPVRTRPARRTCQIRLGRRVREGQEARMSEGSGTSIRQGRFESHSGHQRGSRLSLDRQRPRSQQDNRPEHHEKAPGHPLKGYFAPYANQRHDSPWGRASRFSQIDQKNMQLVIATEGRWCDKTS